MKQNRLTLLSLSIIVIFFVFLFFPYKVLADVQIGLAVHISPEGVIEPFSVSCLATSTNAEALLVAGSMPFFGSIEEYERQPCTDGIASFNSFDVSGYLSSVGGGAYPAWIQYFRPSMQLVVKDTTDVLSIDAPLYHQRVNLYGAYNSYNRSTLDPFDTTYPTLAAGSSFDFDGTVWSNTTIGDGSANYATSTATTTPTCCSSVMFLPGFEASTLYRTARSDEGGGEKRLWEPTSNQNVQDLFLDENGKIIPPLLPEYNVYARDVMGKAYGTFSIYNSFLDDLATMKSNATIADYSAVPYDWRLSLNDLLNSGTKTGNNISYTSPTIDPYIISELRRLAQGSQTGKVTIIGHSNGGLLAKALLQKLADNNDPLLQKVDKLILVAVPQLGTPQGIAGLLHGSDQGMPTDKFSLFLSKYVARQFGQNTSAAYDFLPSKDYFKSVKTPVVTFDSSLPDWISYYTNYIDSKDAIDTFLTDSYGRVDATSTDIVTPDSLHRNLLSDANREHELLDAWTPPAGIQVSDIAGWGIPSTVSGLNYTLEHNKITPELKTTIDGDGTVVTPSALWDDNTINTKRYWVNLRDYNNDHRPQTILGLLPYTHAYVFEVNQLRTLIQNIIEATSTNSLPKYVSTSTPVVGANDTRLVYALHSPLTLDMYDDLGNHTGISTTTGQLEEQIPGTYYIEVGGVKYIFTSGLTATHISMSGYDTGTFTLNVSQLQGDNTISTVTFKDIPTTPETKASMTVMGDISTLSDLHVDENGDGSSNIILSPVMDSVVTYPPPITAIVPVVVPTVSLGNGPIVGSFGSIATSTSLQVQTISTTSVVRIIATTTSVSITSPITFTQVKTFKPVVILSKPKKATANITKVMQNSKQNITQIAQAVSSGNKYISGFGDILIGLIQRTVDWSLYIFR